MATAQTLGAAGLNVVLVARRGEVIEELAHALPSALAVTADLTSPDDVGRILDESRARFGSVDVLVTNGGGPPPGTATDLDVDVADAAMRLVFAPAVRLIRGVLPGMQQRKWGRIVAIGSSSVQQPIAGLAASNLARAALASYLKTLAPEVAADGVTVNMVLPGRIDTPRLAQLDGHAAARDGVSVDEARASSEATVPVGRYGRPEEFAAAVAFLASESASYITGEQLRVDGGLVRSY